jgi:hypothetical protein
MNDVMVFFAFIGFLAAFVFLLSAIVWIVIVVEDRRAAKKRQRAKTEKPSAFDHDLEKYQASVERYRANTVSTQIRQPGSEPDYSGSFQDR